MRGTRTLTALLVLLAACGGTPTGPSDTPDTGSGTVTHADAPVSLDTEGTGTVTLRHEHGLTTTVEVRDGRIEPMVLWDGNWEITETGERIRIGTQGETPLISCWQRDGKIIEPPDEETVRCTQSRMIRLTAGGEYRPAEQELAEALEKVGRNSSVWGFYCHVAGYIAAGGAVLAGADGRALMRDHRSFCDYSVSHGVGSAVAVMNPQDPATALKAICTPDPASGIPAFSYGSQCWHGGGVGLGRLLRFDHQAATRICAKASDPGYVMNCVEGVYSFTRNYRVRNTTGWKMPEFTAQECETADPDMLDNAEHMTVCYRVAAERIAFDPVSQRPDLDEFAKRCETLQRPNSRLGCWVGTGNLAAVLLAKQLPEIPQTTLQDWLEVCYRSENHQKECLERLTLGLVANDQRRDGLSVETIVDATAPQWQTVIRSHLENWLASIAGRSE